ncbi:unnamed protein product [Euphydryas editha]|uniref:Uncharacterized protein n=1 Tax=Euphydryas editha TaxID=104508 RepID=A0AAU9V6W0_EUPED|nr:unnamed protein product [Euphydryas editha]
MEVVTRRYLFDKMIEQNSPSINDKLEYLQNYLLVSYGDSDEDKKYIKKKFSYFKTEIKKRWSKARSTLEKFLISNDAWLAGTFVIPIKTYNKPGRPTKIFSECSDRTKRRKTEEVCSSVSKEVIVHAAQVILQKEGKRNASQVLKDITNSPASANECKKIHSKSKTQDPLTPREALRMCVDADLTRSQYEIVRATNRSHFPCYELVLKAKEECYPPKETIRVTASCAESDLQSLLDHTVTRLSIFLEEVLMTLTEIERNSLQIICKWGCDGSQQAQYKQKFMNDADSDANIFLSSFVPLQIVCGKDKRKIVWQSPTTSSPRYCRPIRFRFIKESVDITKDEINYVRDSVKSLKATEMELNGQKFSFSHSLKMTMVDGKVCNAATDTKSTSRCYICGATSKEFNDLSKKNEIHPESLEFGLSNLHARIRLFESILHLAYKLPIRKYRERKTEAEKMLEQQKKTEIQQRFREEVGILVDMPKCNFGNTNDGNTSRRFFENPYLAAEITGIDFNFIHRIKVILEAISSGHKIDVPKFDKYAMETAKLYVELYGWHPMTPTMHKILVHGGKVIENSLVPIGQLSEEAAEARNKHFRSYRLNFARKFSREECNLDIYHRLLLTSDPLISSMRKKKKVRSKPFLQETLQL